MASWAVSSEPNPVREILVYAANLAQTLDAVLFRHLDVHDNHVGPFVAQHLDAAVYRIGAPDFVGSLENKPQAFARTEFIVDYQNALVFHGCPSPYRRPCCVPANRAPGRRVDVNLAD